MKRTFLILTLAALAIMPVAAAGQFAPPPNAQEFLNFVGGSGQGSTFGVQVGPYVGEFARLPGQQFALYCVDFEHFASNSNGLVNATGLSAGADLSNTRLMDFGRYQQTAYLSSLFESWNDHESVLEADFAGSDFTKKHVWGGLHAAIWNLGTGPADLGESNARTRRARDYFLGLAAANGGSFSTEGWYVLSEADVGLGDPNSGQEFLIRTATPVPEPSTILMFASGLLFVLGAGYRRRPEGSFVTA